MNIIINGENKEFQSSITLEEIINNLQVTDKVMAAAVNMTIIKKENWNSFVPNDGDKLELLQFVGGG